MAARILRSLIRVKARISAGPFFGGGQIAYLFLERSPLITLGAPRLPAELVSIIN